MKIEYSKDVVKYLKRLDKPTRQRFHTAFKNLSAIPPQGDIKPMRGERNVYRLRVGDFRVLFTIDADSDIILVTRIAPRGKIYK